MSFLMEVLKILIPAFISILIIFIGRWLERKKEIEKELREKKLAIFNNFLDFITKYVLIKEGKYENKGVLVTSDINDAFNNINRQMILSSSDKLIKLYKEFRGVITKKPESYEDYMIQLMKTIEPILLYIRMDLGYNNKLLKKGELLCILGGNLKDYIVNEDKTIKHN